ncbi:MAG: DNA-binding transcriptional regulator [Pirellulales bacterium]|nr:DNA-binding transcriptional regulator [Pirellulales bacterium]
MERKRVALLVESSRGSGRKLLHGISQYMQMHQSWIVFHHERALHEGLPDKLLAWEPDGVIARIQSLQLAEQLLAMKVPVVDLLGWHRLPRVPRFGNDRRQISSMAYEHFREHNLSRFAYCGYPGLQYSDDRKRHLAALLKKHGDTLFVFEEAASSTDVAQRENQGFLDDAELKRWLDSLPKPIGLLACNDVRAQQVIATCVNAGIAVPEDVSVLGVDNDEILCELCTPALSSIELANEAMGFAAAKLLTSMMNGRTVSARKRLLEPLHVVQRHSTDTWAIDDPELIEAMKYIREKACTGIQVEHVCRHLSVSPSTLKRRFKEQLGRSPKSEITRIQINQAKALLLSTTLTVQEVAELTGFQYIESFSKRFRQKTGQSPGRFRHR